MSLTNLASLADLPPEIFRDVLFEHLASKDIRSLARAGNKYIKEVSEHYLDHCKFNSLIFLLYIVQFVPIIFYSQN